MSRGRGRIQQAILDLIKGNEHNAWSLAELCRLIYPEGHEKKHRVAVGRALNRMTLPDGWQWCWGGTRRFLFNAYSDESQIRWKCMRNGSDKASAYVREKRPWWVDEARQAAEEARRYRDASPLERIDIDIAEIQKKAAMFAAIGAKAEAIKMLGPQIQELTAKRAELAAAASSNDPG
jgi:hypothetical protein